MGLWVGVFGVTSDNSFGKNGGDDETRTRDLCRDSGPSIGFTTTYKTAGTAKGRLSCSKSRKTVRAVGWVVGWNFLGKASSVHVQLGNDGNRTDSAVLIRFTSQPRKTGLNPSCRRARFAFVSLRPMVLDLGV